MSPLEGRDISKCHLTFSQKCCLLEITYHKTTFYPKSVVLRIHAWQNSGYALFKSYSCGVIFSKNRENNFTKFTKCVTLFYSSIAPNVSCPQRGKKVSNVWSTKRFSLHYNISRNAATLNPCSSCFFEESRIWISAGPNVLLRHTSMNNDRAPNDVLSS